MTVSEAISRADSLKPNSYRTTEKIRWLSYLDGIVLEETELSHRSRRPHRPKLIVHVDGEPTAPVIDKPKTKYDENDLETELLAPYPYDEMYVKYLEMKVDEQNGETARYNNSATLFNDLLADYVKHYHKTHRPNGVNDFKYV